MKTSRRYQIGSAVAAFVMWGSWTFFINSDASLGIRIVASLAQGIASFTITLLMVRAITWLYNRLPDNPVRLFLPAIITVSIAGICLTILHVAIGTPRIASTIAPTLTVAFLFCVYTARKLQVG